MVAWSQGSSAPLFDGRERQSSGADVSAVVIDANEGVTSQDLHVLGMALDDGAAS